MTKKDLARIVVTGAMFAAAALPAFAETIPSTPTIKTPNTLDLACMASAVGTRDTAIAGMFDTLKNAVITRENALKTAWSQTDKKVRRDAIKAVWKSYASSVVSARSTRKAAWTAFYQARKVCGPGAAAEDATTQAADQNL